jgi:hypothetical protein
MFWPLLRLLEKLRADRDKLFNCTRLKIAAELVLSPS